MVLFNAYYVGTFTEAKPDHSILWLGWSMPGPGRWWVDDEAFYMHRTLHPWPMRLTADDIFDVKESPGVGRFAKLMGPYVRIHWMSNETPVYSSFALNTPKGAEEPPIALLENVINKR